MTSTGRTLWWTRLLVAGAVFVIGIMSVTDVSSLELEYRFFREQDEAGPFIYAGIAVGLAVLCIPSMVISLAAGYIFWSTAWAFLASMLGTTVGASISFFLGRSVFAEFLKREFGRERGWKMLARLVKDSASAIQTVALTRASPIPYAIVNYAFSASTVPFWQFLVGTAFGLGPLTLGSCKVGVDMFEYFKRDNIQVELDGCRSFLIEKCGAWPYPKTPSVANVTGLATCLKDKATAADCDIALIKDNAEDLSCDFFDCKGIVPNGTDPGLCRYSSLVVASMAPDGEYESFEKAPYGYAKFDDTCLAGFRTTPLWSVWLFPLILFCIVVFALNLVNRELVRTGADYFNFAERLYRYKQRMGGIVEDKPTGLSAVANAARRASAFIVGVPATRHDQYELGDAEAVGPRAGASAPARRAIPAQNLEEVEEGIAAKEERLKELRAKALGEEARAESWSFWDNLRFEFGYCIGDLQAMPDGGRHGRSWKGLPENMKGSEAPCCLLYFALCCFLCDRDPRVAAGFDVMGPAGTLYMPGMEGGIPVAAPVDDAGARDAGAAVAEDRAVPRPAE